MKRLTKLFFEIMLILVIAALIIILCIPEKSKTMPAVSYIDKEVPVENQDRIRETPRTIASVDDIAVLFGWRKHVVINQQPQEDEKQSIPEEASWLKPMGFISSENGDRSYLFKDKKTSRVFAMAPGSEKEGIKLLAVTSEGFLVEYKGERYLVKQYK